MIDRKLLVSLVILGLAGGTVAGTTLALFSDTEASENNQFQTGTLDLMIDWVETYNGEVVDEQELTNNPGAIFELDDIKPGDEGQATVSLHLEDNPGWIWMKLNQTAHENPSCTGLEDPTHEDCEPGELDEYLEFTIFNTDETGELANEDDVLFQGTAAELDQLELEKGFLLDGDSSVEGVQAFQPGETGYVGIKWSLPHDVGGEVEGDLKEFEFVFHTEQERHNPQNETVIEDPVETSPGDEDETEEPVEEPPENETEIDDPVEEPPENDTDVDEPVEEEKPVYWQVDLGEGQMPPLPPAYHPDDVLAALGNTDDGVTENPSFMRNDAEGQLKDVEIVENRFQFNDEDEPTHATVEFELDEEAESRYLHIASFTLPGPFDYAEIDQQELHMYQSQEFDGGESGELTIPVPNG